MRKRLLRGICLGDYLVEPVTGKVSGPGAPQRLPSKAVEVLLCLAAEPRALISRDQLLSSVWGEGGGSHEALSHAIGALRHTFSDQRDDPRFIQTLPKRGYRLLKEPRFIEADAVVSGDDGPGLFAELTRRGVFETGIAYLVVGWLLVQVADVTFDNLGFPGWTQTFVTYLVIGGFPIALLLAWFLDITQSGPVLDRDIPESQSQYRAQCARRPVSGNRAARRCGAILSTSASNKSK